MTEDLPKLISDEEFAALLKQRERLDRTEHDRLDDSGIRAPQRATNGLPESTVEQKFPRIAEKLVMVWPSAACSAFIRNLVVNSDRNCREGFPEEVIEDLMMLYEINEMLMRRVGSEPESPLKR
jgi:hypothetical protein